MSADPSPARRMGRPTREQARQRHQELLDVALDHFLDRGYEQATMEGIAALASMTKRTVYSLYPDKASLFLATVRRAIERTNINAERLQSLTADDIEETLVEIGMIRVGQVMTLEGLKLQRIVDTESYRFPGLLKLQFEIGTGPFIDFLVHLFRTETQAGRLAIVEPELAAAMFISLTAGGPVRMIVGGFELDRTDVEHRVRYAVRLFLRGAMYR